MKHDLTQENLWSAYMDGQLTPAESAEFDGALTPDERDRMTAEILLENGLTDHLAGGSECPEAVWKHVKADLKRQEKERSGRRILFMPYVWKFAALAATFLVAFLVLRKSDHAPYENILSIPADVEVLSASSDVPATLKDVRQFLLDRNVGIPLKPLYSIGTTAGHARALLGARETRSEDEKVIEIFYECCGEPLKMVIVGKDTVMAARIKRAAAGGSIQASREVGDFRVALVGSHESRGLMDLFSET